MRYEVQNAMKEVRNQRAGWQVRGTKWKTEGLGYGFSNYSYFTKDNNSWKLQLIHSITRYKHEYHTHEKAFHNCFDRRPHQRLQQR